MKYTVRPPRRVFLDPVNHLEPIYEKVCKIIRNYILIISINKNIINTFEFNDKRKT